MKDPGPLADVRLRCVGRCGAFIYLPFIEAVQIISIQGEVRPQFPAYVCPKCMAWFEKVTGNLFPRP
jgi:hypothetical protein